MLASEFEYTCVCCVSIAILLSIDCYQTIVIKPLATCTDEIYRIDIRLRTVYRLNLLNRIKAQFVLVLSLKLTLKMVDKMAQRVFTNNLLFSLWCFRFIVFLASYLFGWRQQFKPNPFGSISNNFCFETNFNNTQTMRIILFYWFGRSLSAHTFKKKKKSKL